MNTIILKVKKSDWLAYSEDYVTNGNWMIHKDYLNQRKSDNALVNMINNTNGFIYNLGAYNSACELPKCSKLIPDTIGKYKLYKTSVLIDAGRQVLRVYQVYDDDKKINVYIDNNYAQMFDDFSMVIPDFKNTCAIQLLDNNNIVGLLMPVNRREFENVTV